MSEKTKFSIGDRVVYRTLIGMSCEKITSIHMNDDGVKIHTNSSCFMWEHELHLATRCNVDMLVHESIEKVKKDGKEIKEEYCEKLSPIHCSECGLPKCGCER